MELGGMQFDDVPSISDNLAGMLGRTADTEPANLRLGTAVSGGGGTGVASVYVGSSLQPAVVGCVCAADHAVNERVVLVAQGPNYVCIGSLNRHKTPYAEAVGVTTVALSASSVGFTANVPFPAGRFSVLPRVTATLQSAPGGSQTLIPRCINISTSQMDVYCYSGNASSLTVSVLVAWHAIQMTPTSADG